eukprot:TRINITY_DN2061_c0_g1_i1.p1 TRINITY_DN2061_c0_g1~~TRINITY_DN2061_c0_g1_i1.p1  ORF type:complete len:972 (+),score=248.82 TRINITY_DN2061_c0_g1_i1:58-2973(+)
MLRPISILLFAVVLLAGCDLCFAKSKPKKELTQPLNIHIVAHTHDDVGWLKTVDEYYIGANNSIQDANVQMIIDTVMTELSKDPNKKFIYVEMAFFWRWWNEQTDDTKEMVRKFVKEGRLEFINGGWSMNDEAATYYTDIVDQLTLGHRFLLREFGKHAIPVIGWHIDPFGHSSTQAALFAQIFRAFFFARIDYEDYNVRVDPAVRGLEMIWQPSRSMGNKAQIFTHSMFATTYCYGFGGFSFEWGDPPIQDDPRLFDMNVKQRADQFVELMLQRAKSFKTNELFIPWGCDFQFSNARLIFKNLDKLMKYVNDHASEYNVKMFYSTPSQYVDAIHKSSNASFPIKYDDFFPYADNPHAFWTGYFTSRSPYKGYVRQMSSLLHSVQGLFATSSLSDSVIDRKSFVEKIFTLQEAMGIAQHHDSVTGTAKQHVDYDYTKRLSIGMFNSFDVMGTLVGKLISNDPKNDVPSFKACPLLNETFCPAVTDNLIKGKIVPLVVYNPTSWARSEWLDIPVAGQVQVFDQAGNPVPFQAYRNIQNVATVAFQAQIPALGFNTYFIAPATNNKPESESKVTKAFGDTILENDNIKVVFDSELNLKQIVNKNTDQDVDITQRLAYYTSNVGDMDSNQASGAYIFRPTGNLTVLKPISAQVLNGPLFNEVQLKYAWNWQVFRLYNDRDHLDVFNHVGPIDISDKTGKEVITQYTSDMNTHGYFYTDSNGLELITRQRNYRATWPFVNTEAVSGNYAPVNSIISIKDKATQLTLLTDRSQGGSSIVDGQLEVMMHRRCLVDDGRGVGEPLNETVPILTHQKLIYSPVALAASRYRNLTEQLQNPVLLFFSTTDDINLWTNQYKSSFAPLKPEALPKNVKILNAEFIEEKKILFRLHHIYSVDEDSRLSKPVSVDISQLFVKLSFSKVEEVSLTGVLPINEVQLPRWNVETEKQRSAAELFGSASAFVVTLNPMDIKTFIVTLS